MNASRGPIPLWRAPAEAVTAFNFRESLPRTAWPLLRLLLGWERLADRAKPVALTFSVFEDFVRLWHHFASTALGDDWQVVIGDSSGRMDPARFPGARLVRVPNSLYHGRKIDLFLRHVISDQPVFLCDDDTYPLLDPAPYLKRLDDPRMAVVSLLPRDWFQFEVGGRLHEPMGSFALMFKPEVFRRERLKFQPPRGLESSLKVFAPGAKQQRTYDTADWANEQLLLRGYRVETEHPPGLVGFMSMTAPRLLVRRRGKAWVKAALEACDHYRDGSNNGSVLIGLMSNVAFERAYRTVFREEPEFVSGFSDDELDGIIDSNPRLAPADRARLHDSHRRIEVAGRRLVEGVS